MGAGGRLAAQTATAGHRHWAGVLLPTTATKAQTMPRPRFPGKPTHIVTTHQVSAGHHHTCAPYAVLSFFFQHSMSIPTRQQYCPTRHQHSLRQGGTKHVHGCLASAMQRCGCVSAAPRRGAIYSRVPVLLCLRRPALCTPFKVETMVGDWVPVEEGSLQLPATTARSDVVGKQACCWAPATAARSDVVGKRACCWAPAAAARSGVVGKQERLRACKGMLSMFCTQAYRRLRVGWAYQVHGPCGAYKPVHADWLTKSLTSCTCAASSLGWGMRARSGGAPGAWRGT